MKEMINRSNYEEYFIDYFDGRLDKIRVEELHDFLDANPDLRAEFDMFSSIPAKPDSSVVFEGKERLKKDTITLFNYKTWLIAAMENDLDAKQMLELEAFVRANPWMENEKELFKKTKLIAETEAVYVKKNSLKRGGRVISLTSFLRPVAAAAAVVALLFFANYLRKRNENVQPFVVEKPVEKNRINGKTDSVSSGHDNSSENVWVAQERTTHIKPMEIKKPLLHLAETPLAMKEVDTLRQMQIPSLADENYLIAREPENKTGNFESRSMDINSSSIIDTLNIAFNIPVPEIKVAKPIINILKRSDVFSEEDLKEFRENVQENIATESKTLVQYAAKELKQLAKSASITMEKVNDSESKSTTYAFVFGNNFSISHTKGR